jgi:sugar O-acyltransferase (sialic acid O-acetyltransferase NeuD family)
MKNIIIIGSGAVAAELTSYIEDTELGVMQNIVIKGYIDYSYNIEKYWKSYQLKKPVLGDIDSYEIEKDDLFIVGIADVNFRKRMIDIIKSKGGLFANIVHPSVIIPKHTIMGEGNVINPYCIIGPNVTMGNFNLLTSQSIISHDSIIGDNNILSTALLCGHVKVGHNNSFGIRSSVIPHITLGNNNTIQAGMIVDRNVEDHSVVFHRFKEKVIAINK